MLPAIPLIDARSDALTTADPAAVRALRDTICGSFKPIAVRALPLADRIARRWLARSRSPYLTELDAIAAHTRTAGTYASISPTSMVARPWLVPIRQVLRRRC